MTTSAIYDTGDIVGLEITFRNASGVATDPTTVAFHLTPPPGGTAVDYVYGVDAQLAKLGTGHYSVDYTALGAGIFDYRFTGTGAIVQVEEAQFFVREPLVAMVRARGYTNPRLIGQHLGRALDGAQSIQAEAVIAAVEQWINRKLGRSWMGASPATERIDVSGWVLQLSNYPVTAITSVSIAWSAFATPVVLTPTTQYTLYDAALGKIALSDWYAGYIATVVYTHDGPACPSDVQLAATMIAGSWLAPVLGGDDGTIRSYSVGGELSVTYATDSNGAPLSIPPTALALLQGVPHRRFS